MSVEIITLATTVVTSFLVPYLQEGADKFLSKIASIKGKGIAQYTLDVTEKIWERVKFAFSSEGDKVTLKYFEKSPEKFSGEMLETLSVKLENDQELVLYLSDLIYSTLHVSEQTPEQILTSTINVTVAGNSFKNIDRINIVGKLAGDSTTDAPGPNRK